MRLNGAQMRQIVEALLDAFPRRANLEQTLLLQMDLNLNTITGNSSGLDEQVFDLVVWTQARGRVEELIAAAGTAVPGNTELQKLAADLKEWKKEPDRP